ncbi:hypothetical protein ACLKA6_011173 [Drosophila palustris]
MSPTSQAPTRTSLFDSCHRKIRLIGGGPVAFLGGLVASFVGAFIDIPQSHLMTSQDDYGAKKNSCWL